MSVRYPVAEREVRKSASALAAPAADGAVCGCWRCWRCESLIFSSYPSVH